MRQTTIVLSLIFSLISIMIYGQEEDSNIISYSEKLQLRLYSNYRTNIVTILEDENDTNLRLSPNGAVSLGVGFNYKGIGLGIAFNLPKSSKSKKKFGNTESFDLRGGIFRRKFGGTGFIQIYKGYYNTNPNDFIEWNNEAFPQINDMKVISLGLATFYVFNSERYSYRSAFVRDEFQKESAGSFLTGIFAYYDEVTTNNGFIPKEFPDEFRTLVDVKEFENFTIGISAGYAYNFIISDKWIFGVILQPGIGYQQVGIKNLQDQNDSKSQLAFQLQGNAAIGYQHKNFFVGLKGSFYARDIDFGPYNFNLSTEEFRLTLGKRFDLKKRKSTD